MKRLWSVLLPCVLSVSLMVGCNTKAPEKQNATASSNETEQGSSIQVRLKPVDSNANQRTIEVLNYLDSLKNAAGRQVLTGQSVMNNIASYKDCILDLKENTGKIVGFTQTWFNYPWEVGKHHTNFGFILPYLHNYSNRGTVSMVLFNPENPWTGKGIQEDLEKNFIPDGKSVNNIIHDTASQEYKVYREQMSLVADCLQELEDKNITVILRMFGECNMGHSWYHYNAPNMSGADFKSLWNYTQDYFINTRGLHNLLFCYEEAEGTGKFPYLGGFDGSKVDINGIQCYVTDEPDYHMDLKLYAQYKAVSEKPIVISQFLLREKYRGNYDNAKTIEELGTYVPDVVGFIHWSGFHRIVHQDNESVLMNDSRVINQEDTGLAIPKPPAEMPYPTVNDQSESSAGFQYQFNTNGNYEGWYNERSMRNCSVSGGSLNEFFYGPDPAVLSPDNLNISASAYKKLQIKVNNHTDSTRMIVEWKTNLNDWSTASSTEFKVSKSTLDYLTYTVDLSANPDWKDTVTRVRIRLAPDSYWGSSDIDYIKFLEK